MSRTCNTHGVNKVCSSKAMYFPLVASPVNFTADFEYGNNKLREVQEEKEEGGFTLTQLTC